MIEKRKSMEKYKKIKDLGVKDKHGSWVQIEILDGTRKGMRLPVVISEKGFSIPETKTK